MSLTLRGHQEWLGFVRPTGLVVSALALERAGCALDAELKAEELELLTSADDFATFATGVLGWDPSWLRRAPDRYALPLPEYRDELRADLIVHDRGETMILVSEARRGAELDASPRDRDRDHGWPASPEVRLERLLRATGVPIGLLWNAEALRLVYAPRGESTAHLTFVLKDMASPDGRPIAAGLLALFSARRLPELPALLRESRRRQSEVSTKLAEQVLAALDALCSIVPGDASGGFLTVLLRLVFIAYAEDRGLISDDETYLRHYSVTGLFEQLREDRARHPDTIDRRFSAWPRLLALFRMIHDGAAHGAFVLPPRSGGLFDPAAHPTLERDARISDGAILRVLEKLLILDGERLSYRTLDVEQLGSVYEATMGDERRRSGAHYTPRSVTESLVEKTLAPLLDALGAKPRPEQILDLKICDPAMGSGAFLVAACRALGAALEEAWRIHGAPAIPPDEDPALLARRMVAERCLYGVDKNPFAVELAKMSLWLVTLAKDRPFTFLDHALCCGDSLVGLTRAELACFDGAKADKKKIADQVIEAFFSEEKDRARRERRAELLRAVLEDRELPPAPIAEELRPFHWELEFPEIFARENPGFDAFIGNPPFLAGMRISTNYSASYLHWLYKSAPEAGSRADLVSYFFRGAWTKLRRGGALGFVTTHSIAYGDTRRAALLPLIAGGGTIYFATETAPWPGEATVLFRAIAVRRGEVSSEKSLCGKIVPKITAFLHEKGPDEDPRPLEENFGAGFSGRYVYGDGLILEWARARQLLAEHPEYEAVIKPYLGGDEVLSDPEQRPRRRVIDLGRLPLEEARARWPLAVAIAERENKPLRARVKRASYRERWWQFAEPQPALLAGMRSMSRVLMHPFTSTHLAFVFVPTSTVIGQPHAVILLDRDQDFCVLQSRVHEVWVRTFGSPMDRRLRYPVSDVFATFPRPAIAQASARASASAGRAYYDHRARVCSSRREGLTAVYNRFHDPEEQSADILELRALHDALDRATFAAYGWSDLEPRWNDALRDEVLARLLALNAAASSGKAQEPAAPESEIDDLATCR